MNYIENELDNSIIRSKGVIYFTDELDMSYMFETAGRSKTLVKTGVWIKDMPEEDQDVIIRENPDIKEIWDDEYGDRMIKLVFIGKDMDKEKIVSNLDTMIDF